MPNLSIRINDQELETLDRLVVAVRASYEAQAQTIPAFEQLARDVTRSSALRDLLLAWKHGRCDMFVREITEPIEPPANPYLVYEHA